MDLKVGLVGNPNVGKSTIFNALTGLRVHTGNWAGKTVEGKKGYKKVGNINYIFEDLPGTYSLLPHSKEEEVTRNFVYSKDYDALLIVCDSTLLERNLTLVLQVLEITNKVVICLNLTDIANKKGIIIDTDKLSKLLGVPIISIDKNKKKSIDEILESINKVINNNSNYKIDYSYHLNEITNTKYPYKKEDIYTIISEVITDECEKITKQVVTYTKEIKTRNIDKYLTSKYIGYITMFLLLLFILWLTISGANYPSDLLYDLLFSLEDNLLNVLTYMHLPTTLINMIVYGVYRTLSWVVSVMLPPMAIFFPLFALLEDLGYLPRIAFNLDSTFEKCHSCGKQALTMAMGFGCNAVGVIGSRIIDSPRERLVSILTNSFVPCNGRFPILISLITMFLITNGSSLLSAFVLALIIVFSIIITFIVTRILSKTILKGMPTSFTLELPSYRKPQIIKVIIRSFLDKTLFVLKRAIFISAPAGVIIWLMANVTIGDMTLLKTCTNLLDPLGNLMGLDGVILLSFILGFPASEIVIPIMIMGYMSLGYMTDLNDLSALKDLLISNGWTTITPICMIIFTLIHYPCLTTVLTIKKETNTKWAILSVVIPLIIGFILCFSINFICKLL